MTKKHYGIIVVCGMVLMLFGGCGSQDSSVDSGQEPRTDQTQISPDADTKDTKDMTRGSIKDLLRMGKALKCTWQGADGSGGETYVDGKKTYTHIINVPVGPSGEMGDSFVITDDAWMYTWSSISKDGIKMSMATVEGANDMSMPVGTEGDGDVNDAEEKFDMQEEYDYSCMPWIVDQAVFTPPTDIVFADMNAMMQQMPSMQDMAGICNMLSGEDKVACEAQMQ